MRFGPKTARALSRYVRARAKHKGAELPQLWLADRGSRPLAPNGIKIRLKRLGQAAGVSAVHAHRWRHTFAHEWKLAPRLKSHPANDDAKAFAGWAWRYEGITRRDSHTDRARLPETVTPHLVHAALKKPRVLVAYGFDMLKPQQGDFLAALADSPHHFFRHMPGVEEIPLESMIGDAGKMNDMCDIGQKRLPIDPFRQIRQARDLNVARKAESAWVTGSRQNPIAGARERRDQPLPDKAR